MGADPTLYGDGTFEFGEWVTPFSGSDVLVVEVGYAPDRLLPDAARQVRPLSLFKDGGQYALTIRLCDAYCDIVYRVCFESVAAFRVMDEIGLMQLWHKTRELGSRPARTSFRVRNHLWCEESPMAFFQTDGWVYVIATANDCVEIVSSSIPDIIIETVG
ncbi:hypothetical protein [Rhizobium herbae]|uniref:Uncharacterized protein n=1 Tax=Rhizobium herbae TaxID=508661 RepID=A0ABS4EP55_9HYPH|nr:hypothetical protein [Rhizobium herbae]MBP1859724.1 hypothetical protein [Rhizobium herbae]